MGSRGTGRLTDYPGSRGSSSKGGGQGGSSGEDRCKKSISEQLEEVGRCDYFKNHKAVPKAGTRVTAAQAKRIAVSTTAGELIGYLPTKYNYLAACLAAGIKYNGKVVTSKDTPVPAVLVDLDAT